MVLDSDRSEFMCRTCMCESELGKECSIYWTVLLDSVRFGNATGVESSVSVLSERSRLIGRIDDIVERASSDILRI